ncbi:MAG TPA: DUF222 domain-containing protein, partial [Acidimicrobiales bacterium]|nr:DUF222 domain-containing protein [Acidimicrobiales bacterium]
MSELRDACALLGVALDEADARRLSGSDCAVVVELLAHVEKRCAGVRVVMAARAAHCQAYRERGYSSPATWLADAAGITAGQAKAALDTGRGLAQCGATAEALVSGEVSLAQAAEIVKTETAVAGSEAALLAFAAAHPVGELRDEGRRRRLAAEDPDQAQRRRRAEQYLRLWATDDGMTRLEGLLAPEHGVALAARVEREIDRMARRAQRDGTDAEPAERLAVDALVRLVFGGDDAKAPAGPRQVDLVVVCDVGAFQRGEVDADEICQIVGAGPVPVAVARELAVGAFIKAVLHDGEKIDTVVHWGRHINATVRTALALGDPPLFTGARCADCGRRYGL